MGLACTKSKVPEESEAPTIVRLSPFRPRRCSSLRRRSADGGAGSSEGGGPPSLLSLAADALAASLHQQRSAQLRSLPPDLSQLLLESLIAQVRGCRPVHRQAILCGTHLLRCLVASAPGCVMRGC